MTNISQLEPAMKAANDAWGFNPLQKVRMPMLENQEVITEEIDALWTDRGLRPNASNLAFLMQSISGEGEVEQWTNKIRSFPVRGSLLVSPNDLYLVEPISKTSSELEVQRLNLEAWYEKLNSSKPHLFTPKALSKFRQGQLSLADSEEKVSQRSLIFFTRQQARINDAFQEGIDAALRVEKFPKNSNSSRSEIKGHIIRYAIAYLAARILQDKNFFGSGTSIYSEDQDPRTLLNWMVDRTNGFFKRTMEESAPHIHELVREQLATHMGVYRVSFALTDHRDVGTLYERAIKRLPPAKDLSGKEWSDLNRHYTPIEIAERMLAALPLERLRPEERYIFDPAAGSGSLLLAATSRLAGMTDLPIGENRKIYLKNHVAGNDLDQYADLISQLRYFLASESFGRVDETSQISDILPFPSKQNFTHKDYEKIDKSDLLIKPKVIVANPPFAEEGNVQKAARFVQKALSWLDDSSQFAFVLPQSFLTGTTHGIPDARRLLSDKCQILEIWQCPSGVIGVDAEQDTCIVIGTTGKRQSLFTISRAIFTRTKLSKTSNDVFLGNTWLAEVKPYELDKQSWSSAIAPNILISEPTICLGELFYSFFGVQLLPDYPPVSEYQETSECKMYWDMGWCESRLWANAVNGNKNEKWIRFGKQYLYRYYSSNPEVSKLYDLPKVLVGRLVNRGSQNPLSVQIDSTGVCPNSNVFCILPIEEARFVNKNCQLTSNPPKGWESLSLKQKKLWLAGILFSRLGNTLSLQDRSTRMITQSALSRLPLPMKVDQKIIQVVYKIIDAEIDSSQNNNAFATGYLENLKKQLDDLVMKSYGSPSWVEIARTGIPLEYVAWQDEQKTKTLTVIGQVLEINQGNGQILLRLSGLLDDNEEAWLPLPQELPGWALDGTVFEAELSEDIETFEELAQRPWALRKFRHTPYLYLTNEELKAKLSRMTDREDF